MHSSRSKVVKKDVSVDDDDDEVDPFELRIEKSGCSNQVCTVLETYDVSPKNS